MPMTLNCRADGETTCTVSCLEYRERRGQCPALGDADTRGRPSFGEARDGRPPVEQVCQVGQPACGLPASYVIGVAGLSNRAEGAPLPIGGFLHLCDFHSGVPAEGWS